MFLCIFNAKRIIFTVICLILLFSVFCISSNSRFEQSVTVVDIYGKKYIKWVSFNVSYPALKEAMDLDISSHNTEDGYKHNWIEILAYLGAKYGGNFTKYKSSDMDAFVKRLESGERIEDITKDMKFYSYYLEAYTAVLAEFIGNYRIQVTNKDGTIEWQEKYGLKVFSPIALGYNYNDYDDFGAGRDFGYKRKHLGHDIFGNIGTPIIAVESGTVEELGWNRYGGWRVGIRSFDKKRYYYYAHLRKDYPYAKDLAKGNIVKAGDVIGYLGRTGYSTEENVNNIEENHLHFGMQLIFDESQKDGINQIWIDVYPITRLLYKNRSKIQKVEGTKEYKRFYDFYESGVQIYD